MLATAATWFVVAAHGAKPFTLVGDPAIIGLRANDVFSPHPPLVGAYSRFGWNHPGPILFFLLAPTMWLRRGDGSGLLMGGALLQCAMIALSARVAWRRGRFPVLSGVMLVQVLSLWGMGSGGWLMPTNATIAVPAFTWFVLEVWSVGLGDNRELVPAVFSGSFLLQMHVGYAVPVAVGTIWAVTALIGARRRGVRVSRRTLGWVASVATLCWLLPAFDLAANRRQSNAWRLFHHLVLGRAVPASLEAPRENDYRAGLTQAARFLGQEFRPWPPWVRGRGFDGDLFVLHTSALWVLVPAALLVLAATMSVLARDRRLNHLVGLMCAMTIGAMVAFANIRGIPEEYVMYWRIPLAAGLLVCALGSVTVALSKSRLGPRTTVLATYSAAALVTLAGPAVACRTAIAAPIEPYARATRTLVNRIPPMRVPTVLQGDNTVPGSIGFAVFEALTVRGDPVRTTARYSHIYGGSRVMPLRAQGTAWYSVCGYNVALFDESPGAREIAAVSPLRRREEAAIRKLQNGIIARAPAADLRRILPALSSPSASRVIGPNEGTSIADLRRLDRLNAQVVYGGGVRCAVFAQSPSRAPITVPVL